ncbi:MAG TPA: rod shape-determining protein RodA [Lentisphaeria bacterium]|nr:MAG: rod shape-determining protein RodA [Lentisphaerae bacterium GWF2_38_69]HBM16470.1 rod shape-determining protein RodA [Lentisphaeria bacterium]
MKHIFQLNSKEDREVSTIIGCARNLKHQLFRLDFIQLISVLCLISFGISFIYSAGQQVGGAMTTAWEKQIIWALIGFAVWLILSYSNYNLAALVSPVLYVFTIILLILIFFIGIKVYGARRWLDIGPIRVQPSEFAKIATLLLLSYIASFDWFKVNKISHIFYLFSLMVIPFLLVLKEPDLGSSLTFIGIFGVILFCARISWKWILIVLISLSIFIPSIYPFLHDYQKERILVFLDPERDPMNQGWTSRQTLLSVGSGGVAGKGLLNGTQNMLGFLPKSVSNSDLIFSVIAEESGFIGAISMILMYMILIFSMIRTAFIAKDKFGCYFAAGSAVLFFEHFFINIGMNIRLMPITGIPLPLISYGGSFMITAMICLGIMQSIYMRSSNSEF